MSILRQRKIEAETMSLSLLISLAVAVIFTIDSVVENFLMLVPILLVGTLYIYETIYTINHKLELFSGVSILSIFGIGFFFIVPLFQYHWDYWPSMPSPRDLREWSSIWSVYCILGFFLIAFGIKLGSKNEKKNNVKISLDIKKFNILSLLALAICLAAQVFVLVKFGGLSGYLNAYEMRIQESLQGYNPYEGMGFLFTFSESFPNVLTLLIIVNLKDKPWAKSLKVFLLLCVLLLAVNLIFGGLRGSRSTTIWSLFWFLVTYHMYIHRVSFKILMILGAFMFSFMSVYTLFKFGGTEGLEGLWDESVKQEIFDRKHVEDSDKQLIVRDAGRTDVQAYILKTFWQNEQEPSLGRTLVGVLFRSKISFIFPSKPTTAVKEKSEIFRGGYSEYNYTTLLAGGFGEYVINFGPIFGIIFFPLLGIYTGIIDRLSKKGSISDVYNLIYPILLLVVIQLLMSDSNVISEFIFRYLLIPATVIVLSSTRKNLKSDSL